MPKSLGAMGMKYLIGLVFLLGSAGNAMFNATIAYAQPAPTFKEALKTLESHEFARIAGALEQWKQNQRNAPACNETKKPTPEPPAAVAYECVIEEPPMPGGKTNPETIHQLPETESRNSITLISDNDDLFLGLAGIGNDDGFTSRMGLSYLRRLPKGQELNFDVVSEIYTKVAKQTWDNAELMRLLTQGQAVYGQVDRINDNNGKIPTHFVDVTRLKAAYSKSDAFDFKLAVGVEVRKTSAHGSKLPPAASIQNWWHSMLGIYRYHYVSPDTKAPVTTLTQQGRIEMKNGYVEAPEVKNTAPVSILAEAEVGKTVQFFQGRCEAVLKTGFNLSTEGKRVVGPNSNANVGAQVNALLLRKKDGTPRLSTSLGGAIFYFPTAAVKTEKEKFGKQANFTIATTHNVGKNGNSIQPFFTFWLPMGQQAFQKINDGDLIQRIGIRFNFGK